MIYKKGKDLLRHIGMQQVKQTRVQVNNLYELEVEYAYKALRIKVETRDLVVERENNRPMNM